MKDVEINNYNYVIRALLNAGIETYIPICLARKIAIRFPSTTLQTAAICSTRVTTTSGTYIDVRSQAIDAFDSDLFIAVSIVEEKMWIVPTINIASKQTFSLSNRDDLLLSSHSSPIVQATDVNKQHVLDIMREHGIGVVERDRMQALISPTTT